MNGELSVITLVKGAGRVATAAATLQAMKTLSEIVDDAKANLETLGEGLTRPLAAVTGGIGSLQQQNTTQICRSIYKSLRALMQKTRDR